MKIGINKNQQLRKLCFFELDSKRNYLGYIDSIYYDAAGNSDISSFFNYPEIVLHDKLTPKAVEFFKAVFPELRKHVKFITVYRTNVNGIKFLDRHYKEFGIIRKMSYDKNCAKWSLI